LNDRVAAVGHSLGGLTAAKTCERDAGVSACVNLDGLSYSVPMHMAADGAPPVIRQPFLFIGKPIPRVSDEALAREHMTRAEDDAIVARFAKRFEDLMRGVQGGSYRVVIDGASHMDFAGGGSGAVARVEKAYLLAFLERYVQGGAGALLDAAPADRTISVTRYGPA
jgi:pimeloyl-ACP methyl ester carboxylesterase